MSTATFSTVTDLGGGFYETAVTSDSDPGKYYSVVLDDSTGRFSCTCPAFTYRKQECKHIKRALIPMLDAVDELANDDLRVAPVQDSFDSSVNTVPNTSTGDFRGVVTKRGGYTSTLRLDANNTDLFTAALNNLDAGDVLVVVRE